MVVYRQCMAVHAVYGSIQAVYGCTCNVWHYMQRMAVQAVYSSTQAVYGSIQAVYGSTDSVWSANNAMTADWAGPIVLRSLQKEATSGHVYDSIPADPGRNIGHISYSQSIKCMGTIFQ